jgi:hypothetical protein
MDLKPQDALNMLDNAVSQMTLSRNDHIALVNAVQVLKALVEAGEKPESASE